MRDTQLPVLRFWFARFNTQHSTTVINYKMDALKRLAGFLWIALGAIAMYLMVTQAATEIAAAIKNDKAVLDTKMFWYIIIPIFTPIMLGLCLFGWYAWKGEYDRIER